MATRTAPARKGASPSRGKNSSSSARSSGSPRNSARGTPAAARGSSVGTITEADLKDRLVLAEEGFISVITVVNRDTGKVVSGPDIHARGVAEDDSVFDDIIPKITAALEDAINHSGRNHTTQQLQQVVRRTIGSWVSRKLRRKPMIVPVVIEA